MPSLAYFESNRHVRRSLAEFLATLPEFEPVEQANTALDLLALCRSKPYDVALVDLLAPGENTLAVIQSLRQECPNLALIVVCFVMDPARLYLCLQLGVVGLLAPEDLPDALEAALSAVLAGERYQSPTVIAVLQDNPPPS